MSTEVRSLRRLEGINPVYKLVDTCAAEFEAETPYYYSTYEMEDEADFDDDKKRVIILGGGPNRIGQGIEFDYCCCHAAFALSEEVLQHSHLSPRVRDQGSSATHPPSFAIDRVLATGSLKAATEELEKEILQAALQQFAGNKAVICDKLRIPKTTLYTKLRRYGLE